MSRGERSGFSCLHRALEPRAGWASPQQTELEEQHLATSDGRIWSPDVPRFLGQFAGACAHCKGLHHPCPFSRVLWRLQKNHLVNMEVWGSFYLYVSYLPWLSELLRCQLDHRVGILGSEFLCGTLHRSLNFSDLI